MKFFNTILDSNANLKQHFVLRIVLLLFVLLVEFGQVMAQSARLQIVNLSTVLGAADIYFNGNKFKDDVNLNTATYLESIDAGLNASFVLATASSISIGDGIASFSSDIKADSNYILVVYDNNTVVPSIPALLLLKDIKNAASDPTKSDVVFVHAAPVVPSLDVVLRSGGMIVGGLAFPNRTSSVTLPIDDNFLDVKASGTTNILGTYRLSLQGTMGKVSHVFFTGTAQNATTLKLFVLNEDGLFPVDLAPVARVQYINALADTVDVYKNGTRFSDNAPFGGAMPYKYIPAELNMNIAVAPLADLNSNNAYATFPFVFDNMVTYTAVSAGSLTDPTYPLQMYFHTQSKEVAPDSNSVGVLFFQGDYSDNTIRVEDEFGNVLFDTVSYGSFSGYQTMTPASHSFKVYSTLTNALLYQTSPINFADAKGKSVTLVTADNKGKEGRTELWRVNTDGVSNLLSSSVGLWELDAHLIYIAPNPVHGFMTIQSDLDNLGSDHNTYTLVDLMGRTIRSNASFSFGEKIDLQDVANGTYILAIRTGQYAVTKKILIQQ
jgi:hypothetical protein